MFSNHTLLLGLCNPAPTNQLHHPVETYYDLVVNEPQLSELPKFQLGKLRPTLVRWGCRVQFPRNRFGLIWSKLYPRVGQYLGSLAWSLVLQIRSSPLIEHCFFGPNQLIFPPKQVPCRFSLNLPLFGLGPSFKGLGTNLKLSTNKIAWIHWSLDLGPSSKVTLRPTLDKGPRSRI